MLKVALLCQSFVTFPVPVIFNSFLEAVYVYVMVPIFTASAYVLDVFKFMANIIIIAIIKLIEPIIL